MESTHLDKVALSGVFILDDLPLFAQKSGAGALPPKKNVIPTLEKRREV